MWERATVGGVTFDFDADATRRKYATVQGTADHCKCAYCANYRMVRDLVYPPDFLSLLQRLGIDYRKETELTHDAEEDHDASYGQAVIGHYAFVGRIVAGTGEAESGQLKYAVSTGGRTHPTTQATYGASDPMLDLDFYIQSVPAAAE